MSTTTADLPVEPRDESEVKDANEAMAFLDILSVVAIISTIGVFLTGITICRTIARIGSTRGVSSIPFVLGAIGCHFWLEYGRLKQDRTMISINLIGLIFQLAYIAYYYIYCIDRGTLHRLLVTSLAACGAVSFYINVISPPYATAVAQLGTMCLILNILGFAAPLAGVKHVMATKSTETLPFALILANLIVAFEWLLYGYLIEDIYMTIPNAIGILLSLLQLSLFIIYPTTPKRR